MKSEPVELICHWHLDPLDFVFGNTFDDIAADGGVEGGFEAGADGGGEFAEAEVAGDGAHEVGAVVGGAAAGDADEGAAEVVVGDGGFPGFDFAAIALKDVAARRWPLRWVWMFELTRRKVLPANSVASCLMKSFLGMGNMGGSRRATRRIAIMT